MPSAAATTPLVPPVSSGEVTRVQYVVVYDEESTQGIASRDVDQPNVLAGGARRDLSTAFGRLTQPLEVVDDETTRTLTVRVQARTAQMPPDAIDDGRRALAAECGVDPSTVSVFGW